MIFLNEDIFKHHVQLITKNIKKTDKIFGYKCGSGISDFLDSICLEEKNTSNIWYTWHFREEERKAQSPWFEVIIATL